MGSIDDAEFFEGTRAASPGYTSKTKTKTKTKTTKKAGNTSGLVSKRVLDEVLAERNRQDDKWGKQDHPDGTTDCIEDIEDAKNDCKHAFRVGEGSWFDVLNEEFYEAVCVTDQEKLRAELVQVAAVAVAWIECIDRRK